MKTSTNYYDEIINDINNLIADSDYDGAILKIREELEMSYIPKEIETMLVKLLQDTKNILWSQPNAQDNIWSLNKITDILSNPTDDDSQLLAFFHLKEQNARKILPVIRDYLKNDLASNQAKIHLLYVLKEQEINEDFHVKKTNGTFVLNPIKIIDYYKYHEVQAIMELLDKWVYNDNPSLHNICLYILENYYYALYPYFIDNNEVVELTAAIIYKARLMHGDTITLEELAAELTADPFIIAKYLEIFEIENVL